MTMYATLVMASGQVFAEDPAGGARILQGGDVLLAGEVVLTGPASAAVFQVDGAGEVDLGPTQRWQPESGPPAGTAFREDFPVAQALRTDVLGTATDVPCAAVSQVMSELFAHPESALAMLADAGIVPEPAVPTEADLLQDAQGLVRALSGLVADHQPAYRALQAELDSAVEQLSAGAASGDGSTDALQAAMHKLFDSLSAAELLAFDVYARHAPEALQELAPGTATLSAERMSGAVDAVTALAEPVAILESVSMAPSDVLAAAEILEDLTVQSLDGLLHVETVAGATRMTLTEQGGDDRTSFWLDNPVAAVGSMLGFDAPEFAFSGQEAF